ncbi:hypothetical protein A9K66_13280 [Mesorhizobium sp. AA23]|nr:hypothetical protein A9K66_13280 [Mesorhizobium sp. AA23]
MCTHARPVGTWPSTAIFGGLIEALDRAGRSDDKIGAIEYSDAKIGENAKASSKLGVIGKMARRMAVTGENC